MAPKYTPTPPEHALYGRTTNVGHARIAEESRQRRSQPHPYDKPAWTRYRQNGS